MVAKFDLIVFRCGVRRKTLWTISRRSWFPSRTISPESVVFCSTKIVCVCGGKQQVGWSALACLVMLVGVLAAALAVLAREWLVHVEKCSRAILAKLGGRGVACPTAWKSAVLRHMAPSVDDRRRSSDHDKHG